MNQPNRKFNPEIFHIKIIEQFQRGYTTGTTGDAIKNKSDKVVVEVNQIHKLTMTKLETLFNTDEEFKYLFYISNLWYKSLFKVSYLDFNLSFFNKFSNKFKN